MKGALGIADTFQRMVLISGHIRPPHKIIYFIQTGSAFSPTSQNLEEKGVKTTEKVLHHFSSPRIKKITFTI